MSKANWIGCAPIHCTLNNGNAELIGANIDLYKAHHIRIERNLFVHLGGAGLSLSGGSKYNTVIGNEFTDISGNNMQIGIYNDPSSLSDEQDSDNQIVNNYVHDTVKEFQGGGGLVVGFAANSLISHNEVTNVPYIALTVGWHRADRTVNYQGNNQVTYNDVSRAMQQTDINDGGLFYLNGKNIEQPRSNAAFNWMHDESNGAGLYVDDGTSNYNIYNNLITNSAYSLLQKSGDQYAKNNIIQYNYNYPSGSDVFNLISNNPKAVNENLPDGALQIIEGAGLEPAYQDIKDALATEGWTAEASEYRGTNRPELALDGSRGTKYETKENQKPDMYFKIDMKETKRIAGVSLQTSGNEGPLAFEVYVSENGTEYGDPVVSSSKHRIGTANKLNLTFPAVSARYIKVVQTKDGANAEGGNRPWSIEESAYSLREKS